MARVLTHVYFAVPFPATRSTAGPLGVVASLDTWLPLATVTFDGDSLGTSGTGSRMTEQKTFVIAALQSLPTYFSTRMWRVPGIKLWITNFLTITKIFLGYLTREISLPTLGTGPAYLLLLGQSVGVILQLYFLLIN